MVDRATGEEARSTMERALRESVGPVGPLLLARPWTEVRFVDGELITLSETKALLSDLRLSLTRVVGNAAAARALAAVRENLRRVGLNP